MSKKTILTPVLIVTIILVLLPFSWEINNVSSDSSLVDKMKGKILLQVEEKGQAWYVNPSNQKRYYLGKPKDALQIMKHLGIGINNKDLAQIPIGIINYPEAQDSDQDGLRDGLEKAIGTDFKNPDSDGDGYKDKTELLNNYNPASKGQNKKKIDLKWSARQAGKIFLQTQKNGEAWYVNPANNKRYFLGKPYNAWQIMKKLGIGVSNKNLEKILKGRINITSNQYPTNNTSTSTKAATTSSDNTCSSCFSAATVRKKAAAAIRNGSTQQVTNYFSTSTDPVISYTMDTLNSDQKLLLANIISDTELLIDKKREKVYTKKIFCPIVGEDATVELRIEKKDNGYWLISEL